MKALLEQSPPSGNPRAQRKEPRRAVKGAVVVETAYGPIQGHLVDVSDSGFRMAHGDRSLEPGQTLRFSHAYAQGTARVIWNRILSGRAETGFFIVKRG